jgi:hypothetical protein
MYSRRRESLPLLASALLVYMAIFFLVSQGCESPTGSADAEVLPPVEGELLADEAPQSGRNSYPWCALFPHFCPGDFDYMDDDWWWGGPFFDIDPADAAAQASLHNAILDRALELECYKPMPDEAGPFLEDIRQIFKDHGVVWNDDPDMNKEVESFLKDALGDRLGSQQQPTIPDVLELWEHRPLKGPFAGDFRLGELLAALEDGISSEEVAAFEDFRLAWEDGSSREKWASSLMAATVSWWHDAVQTGQMTSSIGVSADLAMAVTCPEPSMVGIASAAGVIYDFLHAKDEQ